MALPVSLPAWAPPYVVHDMNINLPKLSFELCGRIDEMFSGPWESFDIQGDIDGYLDATNTEPELAADEAVDTGYTGTGRAWKLLHGSNVNLLTDGKRLMPSDKGLRSYAKHCLKRSTFVLKVDARRQEWQVVPTQRGKLVPQSVTILDGTTASVETTRAGEVIYRLGQIEAFNETIYTWRAPNPRGPKSFDQYERGRMRDKIVVCFQDMNQTNRQRSDRHCYWVDESTGYLHHEYTSAPPNETRMTVLSRRPVNPFTNGNAPRVMEVNVGGN